MINTPNPGLNQGLRLYMAKLRLKRPQGAPIPPPIPQGVPPIPPTGTPGFAGGSKKVKGYAKGSSGVLSSRQRKALPKSSFAIPSKAPGSGSYPINNPSHARNALARVSQFGSPSEKAAVRAKVHAKYPGIGK
jgi:hypothetical protein